MVSRRPLTRTKHTRLCPACQEPIATGDEFVCLFGESVHRECAFYRKRIEQRRAAEALDATRIRAARLGSTVRPGPAAFARDVAKRYR